LCRELGVIHPDVLFEKLTAAQFNEWWVLYNDEPFGDLRSDLRMWAHACLQWGSEDVKLLWPYIEAKMTSEEIRAEMDRIEKAIANVHGRESLDSD
jgi:hypothetical protein